MKKIPLCRTCLSGSLCISCQERFDQGYITQFDIDLAKDFLELEKKDFPGLKKASFYNAVDTGKIVFLVIGQGQKTIFNDKLLKYIKELYEIPDIVLIEKASAKSMIEQIMYPAKLLGVNEIYIPTGEIEYRVMISKEDKEKIEIPIDLLEKASSIIIRGITKVEFT